jgi:hypothetical protein
MVTILTLCLACNPPDLPQTLDYLRGSGRRQWASEFRRQYPTDRRYPFQGGGW